MRGIAFRGDPRGSARAADSATLNAESALLGTCDPNDRGPLVFNETELGRRKARHGGWAREGRVLQPAAIVIHGVPPSVWIIIEPRLRLGVRYFALEHRRF